MFRKILVMILSITMLALIFGSEEVAAASLSSSDEKDIIELFTAPIISQQDDIIAMSEMGIDEFRDDTGIGWEAKLTADEPDSFECYTTSQLVGEYIRDGQLYKEYAITALSVSKSYAYPAVSGYDCTVRTIMHVTWNDTMSHVALNSQSTWVSGGSPTVLVMENRVYLGIDYNQGYVNSSEVIKPGGVYSLISPSSVFVGDCFDSELWCRGTVYFSGGVSIVSEVTLKPNGYWPPEF